MKTRLMVFVVLLVATAQAQRWEDIAVPLPYKPFPAITIDTSRSWGDTTWAIPYLEGNVCYIVCEKLDTVAFEKVVENRSVPCPEGRPGCCVLHTQDFVVWKPITRPVEIVRIQIPCDMANLIDLKYLKVIR